jgi:hypothetical protein
MTLKDWLDNRWLTEHETSAEEVADLLGVADRDLADARVPGLGTDWQLAIAYNAALQLATLALAAEGYRPERARAHERTIESLRYTVNASRATINVLDAVRRKRNVSNYERAGAASQAEADEVYELAVKLRQTVKEWLAASHPELAPEISE